MCDNESYNNECQMSYNGCRMTDVPSKRKWIEMD